MDGSNTLTKLRRSPLISSTLNVAITSRICPKIISAKEGEGKGAKRGEERGGKARGEEERRGDKPWACLLSASRSISKIRSAAFVIVVSSIPTATIV